MAIELIKPRYAVKFTTPSGRRATSMAKFTFRSSAKRYAKSIRGDTFFKNPRVVKLKNSGRRK